MTFEAKKLTGNSVVTLEDKKSSKVVLFETFKT